MLNKRKFELTEEQDLFKRSNAMALGAAFGDSIKPPKGRSYVSPNELPLPEMAMTGQLGEASSLVNAFNQPQTARLSLSPYNADIAAYLDAGGDPTQMRPYDAARNYATTLQSADKQRLFGLETDKVRDQRAIYDVNAAPYAAALRILNDPNLTPEQKQEQIDMILRFQKVSGGGAFADPELKAKADVNKARLMLETGVTPMEPGQTSIAQAEQDIKTGGKIREDEASARFGETYFNRSTPTGAQEYNFQEAGVRPMERLQFEGNEKIRTETELERLRAQSAESLARLKARTPDVSTEYGQIYQNQTDAGMSPEQRLAYKRNEAIELAEAKARADFEFPNNPTAGKIKSMRDAGYGPEAIAAVMMEGLQIPKEGAYVAAPGDPRLSQFADRSGPPKDQSALWRIPQIQQGMTPEQALKSMSKDEIAAYHQGDPEAFNALYEAVKPPREGDIVRNGYSLERVKYKPVPEKEDIEFTRLNDSLSQINRAIEAVSGEGANAAFGVQRGIQSKIPIIGNNLLASGIKGEGVSRRAALFDPIAREKHELYGAALTGGERIDAAQFLPTEYDSAETAKRKLIQFRDRVASVIENRLKRFTPQKGFNAPSDAERGSELIQKFTEERAKASNKGKGK
jgi:hypothetical protein